MTELTTYQGGDVTRQHVGLTPDHSLTEWVANLSAAHTIAKALCSTSFVPQHFRGKPDEAAAAILFGHEVGFSPTTSLQTLYVIGGKPAMYARPMVALVQAAGHEVWTESKSDESVTVCGQRRGSKRVIRETWDIERAKRAGYTTNKKYQTDPQAMLYARAASDVCRQVAADVLTGVGYTVEEMQLSGQVLDDDKPAPKPTGKAALYEAVKVEPTTELQETGEAPTEAQRRRMFALMGERRPDLTDRDDRLAFCSAIVGRDVASSNDLTAAEVRQISDTLDELAIPQDDPEPQDDFFQTQEAQA